MWPTLVPLAKKLSGERGFIHYRCHMDSRADQTLAISKRLSGEMQSLATLLEDQLKRVLGYGSTNRVCLAAGTTRLKKIEFIKAPFCLAARKAHTDYQILEDSLILRARGRKYSSAGIAVYRDFGANKRIEIRIEHERGVALAISMPVRCKRPGYLSTGESTITPAVNRWFLK